MLSHLNWLIKLICDQGASTPKTLIFCNTMNDIAAVSNYILFKLGSNAFWPTNTKTAENCLIGIYHATTWDSEKDTIVNSMKNTASTTIKRVVIATTALSMGVNFSDIRYIINWGPPRSLLDYHQEVGRAGRDGNQSHAITYFYGQQLAHCEDDVKDLMRSNTCYRVASLLPFDEKIQPHSPQHNCCSICRSACSCDLCQTCSVDNFPFESILLGDISDPNPHAIRTVSTEDREYLQSALQELFWGIVNKEDKSEVQFYTELVNDIERDCHKIFTVDDIMNYPVYSVKRALKIFEIFDEIFDDISILPSLRELEIIDDLVDLPQFVYFEDSNSSSESDYNEDIPM